MAKKKAEPAGSPQFAYHKPGEPQPYSGLSSDPGPAPDEGISAYRGGSAPKSKKETDDENTWSGPR